MAGTVGNCADWWLHLIALSRNEKSELTPEQVSSLPYPLCDAAVSESWVLNSGASRSQPHVWREYSASVVIREELPVSRVYGQVRSSTLPRHRGTRGDLLSKSKILVLWKSHDNYRTMNIVRVRRS
jgi:hypothetical protein